MADASALNPPNFFTPVSPDATLLPPFVQGASSSTHQRAQVLLPPPQGLPFLVHVAMTVMVPARRQVQGKADQVTEVV